MSTIITIVTEKYAFYLWNKAVYRMTVYRWKLTIQSRIGFMCIFHMWMWGKFYFWNGINKMDVYWTSLGGEVEQPDVIKVSVNASAFLMRAAIVDIVWK